MTRNSPCPSRLQGVVAAGADDDCPRSCSMRETAFEEPEMVAVA
ncbi:MULTISPECIES: hypothetical protein [Ochrobactrum]|nr:MULTISPECIES: hypothetical protein [Brucella/Ochrobactrum group]